MNRIIELETREQLASIFKALGNPIRIYIIGVLHRRESCVEELAGIVQRRSATVVHHLNILRDAGLVTSRRRQYYTYYSLRRDTWDRIHGWLFQLVKLPTDLGEFDTEFRREVFSTYFPNRQFSGFPPQRRERDVLLSFFQSLLVTEAFYTQGELDNIFVEYTDDTDGLIKVLVQEKLLTKARGGYIASGSESTTKSLK